MTIPVQAVVMHVKIKNKDCGTWKSNKICRKSEIQQEIQGQCNRSKSKTELLKTYDFDEGEFEDAINMQLVKCQTYKAAEHIQQLRMWFSLL